MSSVLTARGVPGGTAARTFDEAYLDELSNPKKMKKLIKAVGTVSKINTYEAMVSEIGMSAPTPSMVMAIDQNRPHSDQYC